MRDRAAVVLQQVERAGVEDVGKQADGAEFGDLVAEFREARVKRTARRSRHHLDISATTWRLDWAHDFAPRSAYRGEMGTC